MKRSNEGPRAAPPAGPGIAPPVRLLGHLLIATAAVLLGLTLDAVAEVSPPETPQEPPPEPVTPPSATRGYINLSFDALISAGTSTEPDIPGLQPGGHDPSRRGFTIQNVELVVDGAVDPYFKGQANIILLETPEGETELELEEVYATTTALPHNLQVKAGHYFTEFGRLNPQHPHFWDFVDQPLSNGRMFGGDGMRSTGVRVSWLMPAAFYSEVFLGVQNASGETLPGFGSVPAPEGPFGREVFELEVKTLEDLLLVPRYALSLDLTGAQTLLLGATAALGPNGTGEDGRTRVYGLDLFWKWKSPRAYRGFPFVKVQAEGMTRDYQAAATGTEPAEDFEDRGGYLQALWGYRAGWVVGARYDRVGGDRGDPAQDALERRWRGSLNLTWFPTEYSKLRFQYNHDGRSQFRDADSFWVQLEFLLGAHAAHKF